MFLLIEQSPLYAQRSQKGKKVSVESYIDNYKNIAISEMNRTEIPASITLAQGILESQFGNSYLVKKGKKTVFPRILGRVAFLGFLVIVSPHNRGR